MDGILRVSCKVVNVLSEKNKTVIELDKNIFRPPLGGQDSDRGHLIKEEKRFRVLDVIKKGGRVYLIVDAKDISKGDTVVAEVDVKRRKILSMLHTAQHIFFKSLMIIRPDVKFENVFLTLKNGEPHGILDVVCSEELPLDSITMAEYTTNEIIIKSVPVKIYEININEVSDDIRIRESLFGKHDKIRVVEIENFDKCACSGTHVSNTKDIRFFKIRAWKSSKQKGSLKYKFVFTVGESALMEAIKAANILFATASKYAFQPNNVFEYVSNLVKKTDMCEKVIKITTNYISRDIITRFKKGEKEVFIQIDGLSSKNQLEIIKNVSNNVLKEDFCVVILTKVNNEIFFTIYGDEKRIKTIVDRIKEKGGRVGGKEIYQGKISYQGALEIFPNLNS